MEIPASTQPSFLIVFLPEISATKLKIPPRVSIVFPKTVTLRDTYNNHWHVEARKVDGHWYFMDGWAKFVEDNSVTNMDMLAFYYSSLGSFDVKLLWFDGSVKEGVGYRKVENTQGHQNKEMFEEASEDGDTRPVVPSGKNKEVGYYNSFKAKGKMVKEVAKEYRDDGNDTWPVVPSGKNKKVGYYNSVKAKGKMVKVAEEYRDGDDDTWPIVTSGKNKKVGYYNSVRAKGKMVKEVAEEYRDCDDDTWPIVTSGKNNKVGYYNSVKAKGKKGKEVAEYLNDDNDEYESDHNFAQDRGQGYWDDEGEEESEDKDAFELVYQKKNKGKEVAKELKKVRDDNNASGSRKKPRQEERNADSPRKRIPKAGLASKLKSSYAMGRINESNRGERMWNEVSQEEEEDSGSRKPHQKKRDVNCLSKGIHKDGMASKPTKTSYSGRRMKLNRRKSWNESEEEDSEYESLELTRRHDKKGKGLISEPRPDARGYTAAVSGNPHQKWRNVDDCHGKRIITSRSAPRPKNPYSAAKMRINKLDNRGKGILNESTDEDSDYLGSEEFYLQDNRGKGILNDTTDDDSDYLVSEEVRSRCVNKGPGDAKKLKSKVGDAKATTSKKPRRNRVNVDWLGRKIFESGLAPRPQCTYFVTTMKPKRMNELYIPKDLLVDENLYLPKKMKLVDPKGRTYTAKLVSWTDGRTFYKGGWNRLCRRNLLRKEDFCICEFGEGDKAGFLFISFIRAGAIK